MAIRQKPFYRTKLGKAYLGDSLDLMRRIDQDSVDLIMTSPPFALQRKKDYGNVPPDEYVGWMVPFAFEMKRIIKPKGSIVIDLGGSWTKGIPTKSLYQWRLLLALCDVVGLHLAQLIYWYNPAKLPTPAEWVNVRRIRIKDAVNTIFWLSKDPFPKADNRNILKPYSKSMMDLLKNGYEAKKRPSGHDISENFSIDNKGAIPPNLLEVANTESNSRYLRACKAAGIDPHPARYPADIPEFFIKFLTDEEDLVVDPFAGSNVTGEVAQRLGRKWIAIDLVEEYLEASKFRFPELPEAKSVFRQIDEAA